MSAVVQAERKPCGIIMPISSIDGCDEAHWAEVQGILNDAIEDAGFIPNLVSNADDVGIIQKRIIQNLYDNPIVVCDVSGKNANVMFELGMRLAFDKPTIIIKDDRTSYSFDTSPIEHLNYPRDLRFTQIVSFKERLTEKLLATFNQAESDPNYTTFLKHFGEFKRVKLDEREVTEQQYVLEELRYLRKEMAIINQRERTSSPPVRRARRASSSYCLLGMRGEEAHKLFDQVQEIVGEGGATLEERGTNHFHIFLRISQIASPTAYADAVSLLSRHVRGNGGTGDQDTAH